MTTAIRLAPLYCRIRAARVLTRMRVAKHLWSEVNAAWWNMFHVLLWAWGLRSEEGSP